jgi:hypothetical protein
MTGIAPLPDVDIARASALDDRQEFYCRALSRHVQRRAVAFEQLTRRLADAGPAVALPTSAASELPGWLLRCREVDALVGDALNAADEGDLAKSAEYVRALGVAMRPEQVATLAEAQGGSGLAHLPTLQVSVDLSRSHVMGVLVALSTPVPRLEVQIPGLLRHSSALAAVRVAPGGRQPSRAGGEYTPIENEVPPDSAAVQVVAEVLNHLPLIDPKLSLGYAELMRLVTVVPRSPKYRQAGSVSDLPGWSWQDVELAAESVDERCHLVVQLIHEYFHTKLNLIEQNHRLWCGDGQSDLLYSPWKRRARPIRQVVHALFTFSAGGLVWARLLRLAAVRDQEVHRIGRSYLEENVAAAIQARSALSASGLLTNDGHVLVDTTVERLIAAAMASGLSLP